MQWLKKAMTDDQEPDMFHFGNTKIDIEKAQSLCQGKTPINLSQTEMHQLYQLKTLIRIDENNEKMNWMQKLCQKSSQITVNIDSYHQKMSAYIRDLQQRSFDSAQEIKGMQLNMQQVLDGFAGYPDIQKLQQAMQASDIESLEDMLMPLRQFITNMGYKSENSQKRNNAYNAFVHLRNFLDSKNDYTFTAEDAEQQIQDNLTATQQNMQRIITDLQSVIQQIVQWNGSPMFINITEPYDETGRINYLRPAEDAVVTVGTDEDGMAPNFEIFMIEGKLTIPPEGIIEDDDFFRNPKYTQDYFNIIRELKNPGSSSAPGKILKLYTSRPRKDRQMYLSDTTSVPGGIWLTSSENNAVDEGFEAGGERDLYKIRIDERYVNQKLNVPQYQHYEVTGRERVPVKSITFLGEIS